MTKILGWTNSKGCQSDARTSCNHPARSKLPLSVYDPLFPPFLISPLLPSLPPLSVSPSYLRHVNLYTGAAIHLCCRQPTTLRLSYDFFEQPNPNHHHSSIGGPIAISAGSATGSITPTTSFLTYHHCCSHFHHCHCFNH